MFCVEEGCVPAGVTGLDVLPDLACCVLAGLFVITRGCLGVGDGVALAIAEFCVCRCGGLIATLDDGVAVPVFVSGDLEGGAGFRPSFPVAAVVVGALVLRTGFSRRAVISSSL